MNLFEPVIGIGLGSVDCVFNIIKEFHNHDITYDQAEEIASLLIEQIRQTRECHEYDNFNDLMDERKSRNLGNAVIDIF